MNDQSRVLVNAITGPIVLITVGSLFALDHFSGYSFGRTWPVLIIVIGVLKLFGGSRLRRWQYDGQNPPPPPPPGAPQGGYR